MTICTSVKVRDGLVLGTDSMTQIWGQDDQGNRFPVKNYANARKLFQIGKLPIGVMTHGLGNIGPRSVYGFLRDFSLRYTEESNISEIDVESVARELYKFIAQAYDEQFGDGPKALLGFFIAGYSSDTSFPEEWEFQLPHDQEIRQVRPITQFGASWRGIVPPFTRLYQGYDPRIMEELKKLNVSEEVINVLSKYVSPIVYDGMPVQDAVNFAVFILQTTIGVATFEIGTPSCGGPLQIATILPEKGFCWVKEPILAVVV